MLKTPKTLKAPKILKINKKHSKYHTPESTKTLQIPHNQQISTTSKNPQKQ